MSETLSIPERIEEQACILALTIPGVGRVGRWDIRGKCLVQDALRSADLASDTLKNLDVLVYGAEWEEAADGDSSFAVTEVKWDLMVGVCLMQVEDDANITAFIVRRWHALIHAAFMFAANDSMPEATSNVPLVVAIRKKRCGISPLPTGATGVFAYEVFEVEYRHDRNSMNTLLTNLIPAKIV